MIQRGVPLETEYAPYTGVKGQCRLQHGRGTISSSVSIPAGFQSIQNYLASRGPFVGTVLITHALQHFKGGQIYRPTQAECTSNVGGHAWLVAGIDYEGNNPYYIIKNSWGTSYSLLYRHIEDILDVFDDGVSKATFVSELGKTSASRNHEVTARKCEEPEGAAALAPFQTATTMCS
ncbi:unnamed protein product [Gongylonema pulchrum]|uniref:Pept_C1 domain-containing protein n=1 Tax=Gongylonema pulchrum TaxID=637853 RepID=A0A183DVJ4_9BILA|nr:unnamed protein product [Gongylonema pulchrum]